MPFPAGVDVVTLNSGASGYRALDGTPYQGTLRLTPSVSRVVSAEHGVIALGVINVTLGASGDFTQTVLATDAEGFVPSGWTYRVDEEFTNAPGRAYSILLPAAAPAVALPSLSPVEASNGTTVWQPGGASPSDTVTTETTFGQASGAGASARYSRGDHTHGTPAAPAVGTTAGTYAAGNDSRLSDSRTPTLHAASHASGGSDPVTLAQSQVTNLITALGGLLPTAGGTVTGNLTVNGRLANPVGSYGVIAPSRTSPAWRKASTAFIFQAGHGWTANGAASSNLNNTAAFVRGTQCASITTNTTGGSANLRKFGMSAMDLTGKMLRLICRVDDITKVSDINVFAGTSNLANYFKWRLWETAGTSQLGNSGEWITLTFGWSSINSAFGSYTVSSTGVPSTTSGITDLEVQAIATNGNAITLDVQALEIVDGTAATFPNGLVSIVFDDGDQSIWNLARPSMDTYGYQGTNYVIVSNLGSTNYMTAAQVKQLQDFSGWEPALHAYSAQLHTDRYTAHTAAEVDDDIRLGKQWLVSNGFRGEGIAYPGGEYQTTTDGVGIDSIAARYFSTGRTVLFQTGYPTETFPAGMPMRVRAVSSISSTQAGANNPTNLVAAGGLLDKCQLNSGWLILVFHKIVTGTATVSTECSQSDFQTIMAGISARGIPVVPVSDVHRLYG